MSRITRTLCVLFLLVAAIPPSAAVAHEGNPNYRSEITSIEPAALADGLRATVQNFDDNVELVNRTGKEVVVKGYDGEPYVRIGADGLVEVNLNSPTYYLNEDRFAAVDVPERADAKAEPAWEEVEGSGVYAWHDHRSHYMSPGTPSQVKDESKETKVFDYSIPITVGGKPAALDGTLTWVGKQSGFPVLPFVLLAAVIVIGAVALSVFRNRRRDGDDGHDGHDGGQTPDAGESRGGDRPAEGAEAW
ncbi:MAG TPA: hypothetical protein VMF31_03215 [Solirubrobacterales bacterium]|nr:hypothetical protein [Solirubrobacterales bacterium]